MSVLFKQKFRKFEDVNLLYLNSESSSVVRPLPVNVGFLLVVVNSPFCSLPVISFTYRNFFNVSQITSKSRCSK